MYTYGWCKSTCNCNPNGCGANQHNHENEIRKMKYEEISCQGMTPNVVTVTIQTPRKSVKM
jgi:hypothetical protein